MSQPWTGPFASFSWNNLGRIRVYGQDPEGNIMEWQYDGGPWTGPTPIGAQAKYGTALSVTGYGPSTGTAHLRVYYYNLGGRIAERVYEDGWKDGAVLP